MQVRMYGSFNNSDDIELIKEKYGTLKNFINASIERELEIIRGGMGNANKSDSNNN